jgi:hypothetical protein
VTDPTTLAVRMVALALDIPDSDIGAEYDALREKAGRLFQDLVDDEVDVRLVFQTATCLAAIVAGFAQSIGARNGLDPATLVAELAGM